MTTLQRARHALKGFSLTEMAVVLVIVALLIGGLIIPFGMQQDLRAERETQIQLTEIKEALLGFAAASGRLPCPATTTSVGQESTTSTSPTVVCTSAYGYLPAAALGISNINSSGLTLDGWHQPIRYAVISKTINGQGEVFTTAGGIKAATMTNVANTTPLFSICTGSTAITSPGTGSAACTTAGKLTDRAVAVIWSTGKNTETGGTDADESQNPNPATTVTADPAFVYHEPAPDTASGGEFDDQVVWIATNVLFNRMIAAGQLP